MRRTSSCRTPGPGLPRCGDGSTTVSASGGESDEGSADGVAAKYKFFHENFDSTEDLSHDTSQPFINVPNRNALADSPEEDVS